MRTINLVLIVIVIIAVIGFILVATKNKSMNSESIKNIQIEAGMPRATVEERVANILKTESQYNAYQGSVAVGDQVVKYSDGKTTLEVTYAQGSPAPWVTNSQGLAEHYPPVDQSVRAFRFYESDNVK